MCDEYQNLLSCTDPEGDKTWGPNTGLNPLKITKLSSQH